MRRLQLPGKLSNTATVLKEKEQPMNPPFTLKPALAVLLVVAGPAHGAAQASTTLTVPVLLQHLYSTIRDYSASIPSVFCNESLRTTHTRDGHTVQDISEQSVLQVRRNPNGDFTEEREVTLQNGKPVGHSKVANFFKLQKLPVVVHDGFGRSFSPYLGADVENCNTYKLIPPREGDGDLLVLQVTPITPVKSGSHCTEMSPDTVDTFWIDKHTYQIQREREQDPSAMISHGVKYAMEGTINYQMVSLGPKSYLLSSNVHATVQSANGREQFGWDSTYSNCHAYSSSSTILSYTPMMQER
jgi:hypothetical protein